MTAELVSCPECKRKLRVPNDLVGKVVKCPTCGQTFTADPEKHAPAPPPAAAEDKPARTSRVGRDKDEDDDDRPRRRRLRDDDDDDDDRPRRRSSRSRRDDDDDDDDYRRRRRRSRYGRDDDDDDDDDRPRRRRRDLVPHRGGTIQTLGILSLVLPFLPFGILASWILGIIAWVMGNSDLAEMRAGRMDREGESQTNNGRICGIISVILHGLVLLAIFGACCAGGMSGHH
jgi:predicted Zn finger-like uncharacterized protein